jgi:hypothetical protein
MASTKPAPCHPDRLHHARGLCRTCYYENWQKTTDARKKQREYGRNYYALHREQARASVKARWEQLPKAERARLLKAKHLKMRYQLTPDEYAQMLIAQGGKCAVCEKPFRTIDVDHDHDTGDVRGLLCRGCNLGVEFFIKHRDRAESYLASAKQRRKGAA